MEPLRIPEPALEKVARVHVELEPPRSTGPGPWGERRLVPIVGGHFEGPRLRGDVLPGGADWQVVHASGAITIDTRYALRTHDDALIYIGTRGVRTGPPETLARLARGETVDPTDYYFRVVATLETGAPPYYWLNESIFVASALRHVNAVVYDLYRLS
ncbi:MAG: DUF3237 domain-containing protein [Chloroflexi bacterium]|nr:DUF3237 domain-containing protein [Chloroflexota bacterium]